MGFLDNIVSAAQELMKQPGNTAAGDNQQNQQNQPNQDNQQRSVMEGLVDMFKTGGTQNILGGFTSQGLGGIINSWIGTGANSPISPEQIRNGLGADKIRQLAQRAGIPEDRVMEQLRNLLPGLVDRATPQGSIEPDGSGGAPEGGTNK